MLKLVSFRIQAHLNAFLQILEYFPQICLGPLAKESPCTCVTWQGIDYKLPEDDIIVLEHVRM